ncbi:MAG: SLC13 family permease [Desulfovibrio sp.]|jgi:di/tricarboxylate transporter|nr:SLC13 family permease [Desulfovibrio sp.]
MDNAHQLVTLLTLAGVVTLLAGGFLRNDLAAVLTIPALTISGVLEPAEALSGFSSTAVIIIACMFVVGESLIHTGVTQRAGEFIVRCGGADERKIMILIMLTAALVGSVMSSAATAAIFIPISLAVAEKAGLHHKRLLMPLAAASLISGMMTLVATTPNLILNEALQLKGYASLSFFSFTPFGLINLGLAVAFMTLFGQNMLAKKRAPEQRKKTPSINDLLRHYRMDQHEYLLRVTAQSELVTCSVATAKLSARHHVTLLAVKTSGKNLKKRILPVQPEMVFRPGDLLLLIASPARAAAFAEIFALEAVGDAVFATRTQAFFQVIGIAELMLHPDSTLIGKTLKETQFRSSYHGIVLGIRRKGVPLTEDVSDILLKSGDVLLVCGAWQELIRLSEIRDQCLLLTLPRDYKEVIQAKHKEKIAMGILAAMISMMVFTPLSPVISVFAAACALLLTRCVPIGSVYKIIDWQSLVMIAGMLPLALAMQKTGIISHVAAAFFLLFRETGPVLSLAGLFLLTALMGMVMSSTATAVLIAPVAVDVAVRLGIPPQACAMVAAIACSSAFVSPLGSPVAMLVREPGGYRLADYAATGFPLLLLCMSASVSLAWLFWLL